MTLQQENDRLKAELANLRQKYDRLYQSEARYRQVEVSPYKINLRHISYWLEVASSE